jgi:anthranilate phosphoribosyltransferase
MDELTTTGETEVSEWKDGLLRHFTITPEAVGLPRAALADLRAAPLRRTPPPSAASSTANPAPTATSSSSTPAAALLVGDAVETLRKASTSAPPSSPTAAPARRCSGWCRSRTTGRSDAD